MLDTLKKAFFKAAGQVHLPINVAGTTSLSDRAAVLTLAAKKTSQPGQDLFSEGGQFSPGEPLSPLEPSRRAQQFQFNVGRNITISPRTEEGRTPFAMLRSFADSHDVSRLCIEIRKEQIGGMAWDIVPVNAEDRDLIKKYKSQVAEIREFFENPDGNCSWYDWLGQVLEEVFVVDALSLYKRRTRGGKLFALEVVDGSTIKPLIDSYGRVPVEPYPAYQQIIYGYPRGGSEGEATTQGYSQRDLIYNPKNRRAWTMYGFSPIEYILMKINLALNRDMFMLSWFNQGTLPDGGIYSLPPTSEFTGDVEKIAALQAYIDDMCSGQNRRRAGGVLFLPDGQFTPTKEFKFDPAVDEWLARIAAVAFGVNPQHFVKMMTRSTGETQKEMTSEIAIKPSLRYLESILTRVIKEFWDVKGMTFKFLDDENDPNKQAEINVQYVKTGILSIDEVRGGELGLPPLFGEGEPLPNMVFTASGFLPITRETVAQAALPPAPPPAPFGGGEGDNLPGQDKQPSKGEQTDQNGKPVKAAILDVKGTAKGDDSAKPPAAAPVSIKKKVKADLSKMERYFETAILRGVTRPAFHSSILTPPLLKMLNSRAMALTETSDVHALFKAVSRTQARKAATVTAAVKKYTDIYSNMLGDEADKLLPKIDKASSAAEMDSAIDDHEFFVGYDVGPIVDETVNLKENTYSDAEKLISSVTGSEIDLKFSQDYAAERAQTYAGDLIKDLSDSTRSGLKSTIAGSVNNAEDWSVLADKLASAYEFSDQRAELIARTESGRLYNEGFIDAARESGLVTKVLVSDGEDYDDECAEANGEEWDLDEALDRPIEHPNCVREFQYIIDEG